MLRACLLACLRASLLACSLASLIAWFVVFAGFVLLCVVCVCGVFVVRLMFVCVSAVLMWDRCCVGLFALVFCVALCCVDVICGVCVCV